MKQLKQSKAARKKVSMAQVARDAGVSSATVSRVLNGMDPVSPETRERVMATIEALGYVPDVRLSGFFRRLHGSLRAVVYTSDPLMHEAMRHSDGFYSRFLGAVQEVLGEAGCHLMLADVSKDVAPDGVFRCVSEKIVDGVIAETSNFGAVAAASKYVPTVLFNSEAHLAHVDVVLPDVERAAMEQIEHLRKLGHTRIACFRASPGSWQDGRFRRIYEQEVASENLPDAYFSPIYFGVDEHAEAVEIFLDRLFSSSAPPTAILTYDQYAEEIFRQLRDRGFNVPEDVSLIGYDDTLKVLLGSNDMGLTTFRQDAKSMAEVALKMLQKRIKTPEAPAQTISVGGRLVVRESTAQCKAAQ